MSDSFKFQVNVTFDQGLSKRFDDAAKQAFKEAAAVLDGRFQDAISGSYWPWPFPASNGKGSPRSIVDTGALKQSRAYSFKGTRAEWKWTASYAAAVHEGARLWNGATLPARPWTTAVLEGGTSSSVPVYPFTDELKARIIKLLN